MPEQIRLTAIDESNIDPCAPDVFGTRVETESALVRFSFMPTYLFEFHHGEPRITREAVDLVSDAAARHYAVRRARDLTGESVGDARQWIEVRDEEGRNLLRLSFSDAASFGKIAPYP